MARMTEVIWIDDNTIEYIASVRSNDRKDPNHIKFTIDVTGMTRKDGIDGSFMGSNYRIMRANHLRDTKTHEELTALAKTGVKGRWNDEFGGTKVMSTDKAVNIIHNLNREGFINSMKLMGATMDEAILMWDRKVQSILKKN